jgi:quercetin dioxygenase-like cupin family protein
MLDVLLKRFEQPDETRRFEKGRFDVVRVGGLEIGRASYEPGWKWSIHVAPTAGSSLCPVEHVGMVLSGVATVAFEDGRIVELRPGDVFHVPPTPHDSWVVGPEPYVSLHFLGASRYASPEARSAGGGAPAR